jgi:radical SAM superfamily enzyme YgiQ (UPF0313 family)
VFIQPLFTNKELDRNVKTVYPIGLGYLAAYVPEHWEVRIIDEEALDLASKAGCGAMFVGFESVNPDSLKDMNKKLNLKYGVESYNRLVENAQRRKILIVGEMIVGTDSDDEQVLEKTEQFLDTINFDILRLQIMQPLPGTKLFDRLAQEERLDLKDFPEDWRKLADEFTMGVHYQPKNLDRKTLQRWVKRVGTKFYSPWRIIKRAWKCFLYTLSPRMALTIIVMSFKSRKTYVNAKV